MTSRTRGLSIVFIIPFLASLNSANSQCCFTQADRFDNVWVVNHGEVICFDVQRKTIGTYSNILLGNPSSLDALDPFRVIVYYSSFQSLVVLNNRVAEISKPIPLREKGITDALAVCRSGKGGVWVLDRGNWAILHFDSGFNLSGEKITLDPNFSNSQPIFMQEHEGVLYIVFKDIAICRYDSYGARMGDIPLRIDSYFSFIDGSIVYQSKGTIYEYAIETNQKVPFSFPVSCIPIKVQGQLLYFDGRILAVCK
ncbi:MAG: hypothetical protein EHM93_18270 [Bacteroidales bacterium]|nr:MAG: hypothetical protein EHM93_18270 [Bacteroidales bacterium]